MAVWEAITPAHHGNMSTRMDVAAAHALLVSYHCNDLG